MCGGCGRINLAFQAAMMAQYQAIPREGHIMALEQFFAYLKKHNRSKLVFDPMQPDLSDKDFVDPDWSEFYFGAKEVILPNAHEIWGKSVYLNLFVDASHASNVVTHQSHTGFLIFIGRTPIIWHSQRQNTIESAAFGS